MFDADFSTLMSMTKHSSYMFHVMIGIDPLGDFSAVEGLGYKMEVEDIKEAGRNHSPLRLPQWPGQVNDVTLRWGMIVRSKLFEWMEEVEVGGDFMRDVRIFQLSRRKLPLRIYTLIGCWPSGWEASSFSTESAAELSTESLTLACDQVHMTNLSLIAILGDVIASFMGDSFDATEVVYEEPYVPPAYVPIAGEWTFNDERPAIVERKRLWAEAEGVGEMFSGERSTWLNSEYTAPDNTRNFRKLEEGRDLGEFTLAGENGGPVSRTMSLLESGLTRPDTRDAPEAFEMGDRNDLDRENRELAEEQEFKFRKAVWEQWSEPEFREVAEGTNLQNFLWGHLERVYQPASGVWPQPQNERPAYEALVGKWELVQQERKYEAQVGIWGEFEHLDRSYEAAAGGWGFEFEED